MQLLHPWLLLGLVLVPAVVLLHVFRVPGRRHEVSYLSLWQNVLERLRPDATERLKRFDWLLFLEVLVILLLVLGISQPVIWRERPHRHVGFILDTSASMNTVEGDGRTRWQQAREKINGILDGLSDGDLVSFFGEPTDLVGLDVSARALASELSRVNPDEGVIDPDKLLADGLLVLGKNPGAIYLVTDKAPVAAGAGFDDRLKVLAVGGPSRNAGIVAFSVSPGEGEIQDVFVRISNYADTPAARRLVLTDGSGTLAQVDIELPAGSTLDRVLAVKLSATRPVVQAKLTGVDDGLAADDEAAAVLRPLMVVATGEKISPAYARLFGGPVFQDTLYVETDPARPGEVPADALLIAEGVIPKSLGVLTVLVNAPAGEIAGITIGNPSLLAQPASPVAAGHDPLTAGVNLSELRLADFRALVLGETARPLMHVAGRTVAAVADVGSTKVVVLGFDVTRAGWPLRPSFVVFWANVLDEAKRRTGSGGFVWYRTGDVVRLPLGTERAQLRGPLGTTAVLPDREGWGSIAVLKAGLYEWRSGDRQQAFAVNLLSEIESDNRPRAVPERRLDLPIPIPASAGMMTPIGPWLCLLAGMLAVVWWHFRR